MNPKVDLKAKLAAFLGDIDAVCKAHGLEFDYNYTGDCEGEFIVEAYRDNRLLKAASLGVTIVCNGDHVIHKSYVERLGVTFVPIPQRDGSISEYMRCKGDVCGKLCAL